MGDPDDIPEGRHAPSGRDTAGMSRSDRVLLSVACLVFAAAVVGLAILVSALVSPFVTGIGLVGAMMAALPLAIVTIVFFAFVAGDVVGELPSMIVGLISLFVFYTAVVAIVF